MRFLKHSTGTQNFVLRSLWSQEKLNNKMILFTFLARKSILSKMSGLDLYSSLKWSLIIYLEICFINWTVILEWSRNKKPFYMEIHFLTPLAMFSS